MHRASLLQFFRYSAAEMELKGDKEILLTANGQNEDIVSIEQLRDFITSSTCLL